MSSVLVLRNRDLDVKNQFVFSEPKINEHKGKAMYINVKHEGKTHKEALIQTPWMFNPFGITTSMQTTPNDPLKYFLDLSFGTAPSEYCESFHGNMKLLDEHVKESACDNSRKWLGKPSLDEEYLGEFYKPIVRQYRNKETKQPTGEFPDTVKFKIPFYQNDDGTTSFGELEVYDSQRNKIPIATIDDLKNAVGRSNRVRAIVKAHSVWTTGNDFGVSWQVVRIQVLGSESIGTDCQFPAGSDEGENSDEEDFE